MVHTIWTCAELTEKVFFQPANKKSKFEATLSQASFKMKDMSVKDKVKNNIKRDVWHGITWYHNGLLKGYSEDILMAL